MRRATAAVSRSPAPRCTSAIARFAARLVSGAFRAMSATYRSVSATNDAFGTTRFTSPTACASGALYVRAVKNISAAADGPTTLTHLRQSPKTADIPVVFMTARAQPRKLEHFVSLGAEGVIAKPFDPMTLAAAVRNYVGGLAAGIAARRASFLERTRENAKALDGQRATIDSVASKGIVHRNRTDRYKSRLQAAIKALP